MIIRAKHDKNNPYFMLNRVAVEDEQLSFRAVGLHAYLMSKPDTWTVREADLVTRHKEGSHAVRSALKELREAGYVETIRPRDEKGRMLGSETIVHELPINRDVENPRLGQPELRTTLDIVSNEFLVSNEGSNYDAVLPTTDETSKDQTDTKPVSTAATAHKSARAYKNRQQLQAATRVKAAKEYGLLPSEWTVLVDAYLKACGTWAVANTDTDVGENELNKAQDAAVAGLANGVLEPKDVEIRLAAIRENWNDPDKVPSPAMIAKQVVKGSKSKKDEVLVSVAHTDNQF